MVDRLTRKVWAANKGEANKRAMKRLVDGGVVPGILAYAGDEPIAWCAVAPRETLASLARSRRTRKPVDDRPVWSITCLFVARPWRRRGVTPKLLDAAAKHVGASGGNLVEGFPVVPSKALPDPFVWTGIASAYLAAGFEVVAKPSRTKRIVRREVGRRA